MEYQPGNRTVRRHDIDALRVLAFGLLILYHVGMFYVADWGWHVKSGYQSETLQYLMLLVNQWRMPLIFLVSGVAVHFLLRKLDAGAFASSRARRLLLPLAFGMAVIVPPQAYLQAVSNGAFEGSYIDFLWRYFTFAGWPAHAFDGADIGITWNHLWYLPYLLSYSLLLAALLPLLRSRVVQAWIDGFHGWRGWKVFVLPVLPFFLYTWLLRDAYPKTGALFDDWYAHALYFTMFLAGYLLGAREGIWAELRRLRWISLTLAAACYLLLVLGYKQWPVEPQWWEAALRYAVLSLNPWCWLLAVLGWASQLLNRPFRWLPYATEAVYPWYILHQTITVVAGYQLARMQLGPVIEPVLVVGVTVIGCLVLHEFVIRRVTVLRPLFGLKTMRVAGSARVAASA